MFKIQDTTLHLRHRIVDLSLTTFLRHDVLWNKLIPTPLGLLTERDSQMRWFWPKHEVTDSILVGVFTVMWFERKVMVRLRVDKNSKGIGVIEGRKGE